MWDYKELDVWHRARRLTKAVYELTTAYPKAEQFGLTAQTRRAAVSVTANLAEGTGRRGRRELSRFVEIATGSAFELESHLHLASDLGFVNAEDLSHVLAEVDGTKRMLIGLSRSLRRPEGSTRPDRVLAEGAD
jgi:four helix bundle protein